MDDNSNGRIFWQNVAAAIDPKQYKPTRNPEVVIARLDDGEEPYYVLKNPHTRTYIRLSEADIVVWWQMNGQKTVKDLLFYCFARFRTLPIGRLSRLISELKEGFFLQETPVGIYAQAANELARRAPESRGRRLIKAFFQSKWEIEGLDPIFTRLYRWLGWLFLPWAQSLLLLLIIVGGALFARLVWNQQYTVFDNGVWGLLTLLTINLLIIGIHEMAHGLAVKRAGRQLNRGGFLIYWGLPAFYVDTRDVWLEPRRERIFVSWVGPYSGLLLGGLAGIVLTAVSAPQPFATLIYQFGFLAFLSVLVNLNPLLELDAYFMLMDWLDMPNLRRRAFYFWRVDLRPRLREFRTPRRFWRSLGKEERILMVYGALALLYSLAALGLVFYFWRTRFAPLVQFLWQVGIWGRWLVLLATAVLVIPPVYFLFQYGWARLRVGLEWLARRKYLARPVTLALLVGAPLAVFIPLIWQLLGLLPQAGLWQTFFLWLLYLAATAAFGGVGLQLVGSRLQWGLWALTAAVGGQALAWSAESLILWRYAGLLLAGGAFLACGIVAWFTVRPSPLTQNDLFGMGAFIIMGLISGGLLFNLGADPVVSLTVMFLITAGCVALTPLLLNFWRTRFALPWLILLVGIWTLPWLALWPDLALPVLAVWLFAGVLYWLLGTMAQFDRQAEIEVDAHAWGERQRLVQAYQHFRLALFAAYEPVFGRRPLSRIRQELAHRAFPDAKAPVAELAANFQQELLLIIDRLDDLAGDVFTHQAGQAAYDSLPWLEAETLGRYVLAASVWGTQLAQGFIRARNQEAQLIRQADIFAGFDHQSTLELLDLMRKQTFPQGTLLAREAQEADTFYLIVEGNVEVMRDGEPIAELTRAGYFGMRALLDTGSYSATYRALTLVELLSIERAQFDPLWRADTTLASQVQTNAAERALLHKMPLFSGLSPQQLTTVDARLERRAYVAGEVIVQQGQARSYLFIVAEGEVVVSLKMNGEEKENGRLGPGEHFGEFALFADLPYAATYRAAEDCELLLLDEPTFDRLAVQCEQLAHYAEQIGTGKMVALRTQTGPTGLWA